MTRPGSEQDDRLFDDLRTALREAGPPSPAMTAGAEAAFSWRTVDAELAALTYDSVAAEGALVRETTAPRFLVFEGGQLSVELEHTDDGLVGQLLPPVGGEVTLLGPATELAREDVDELGCFRFSGSVSGLVRLSCRTPAGAVVTDWVRL